MSDDRESEPRGIPRRHAEEPATLRRRPRHVLVVGGAGYVGSVLTPRLLDRGYRVTVMDALMYGDEGIRDLYGTPGFEVVRGDLRDLATVVGAVRRADAIVHLGALVGDPACDLDEQLALEVNLDATLTLATVARGLGVKRFVFASTCSVYGAGDGLLTEESPVAPVSLYARTKVQAEQLLLSMEGGRFTPVILRFGTFYGLSPRARFDLVVNLLVAKAFFEGEFTITGGRQWRPFIHVADGAEAILRCLEAPRRVVDHRVFNVGSDEQNHTLAEMASIVASGVPGSRVRFEPPPDSAANYRVSFERIRDALAFHPSRTPADGVAEVRSLLEAGGVADYGDPRYSNHKSLVMADGALGFRHGAREPALSGGVE